MLSYSDAELVSVRGHLKCDPVAFDSRVWQVAAKPEKVPRHDLSPERGYALDDHVIELALPARPKRQPRSVSRVLCHGRTVRIDPSGSPTQCPKSADRCVS